MRKHVKFLEGDYAKGSYFNILKQFLNKRRKKGVSERTIERLFYNLHPIGTEANNQPIKSFTRNWLMDYIDQCWRRLAPDTIRVLVGDIRQFFKWCKKKKYHRQNIAKRIKPVSQNRRRHRRAKAAPEDDIHAVMTYLANQLKESNLIYRDLFGVLQAAELGWSSRMIRTLRDLLILTFLYETGARGGELAKLGSKIMDMAIATPQKGYIITLFGKTSDRDYYFTERTAELWRLWQVIRPNALNEFAVIGWRKGRDDYASLRAQGISLMLVRKCKEAGVQQFRSHALRHAKVKRARKTVGIEVTRQLIDHSTLRATRGYAGIDEDEIMEAAILTGLQLDLW